MSIGGGGRRQDVDEGAERGCGGHPADDELGHAAVVRRRRAGRQMGGEGGYEADA